MEFIRTLLEQQPMLTLFLTIAVGPDGPAWSGAHGPRGVAWFT
jgi:hypothetical protein